MSFNDEHAVETFRSLISISTEAFKALQWLNGGAVVALLAYFGQVSAPPSVIASARFPLALFVGGLVAGCLAFFTAYLTQLALHNENVKNESFKGPKHGLWLWVTFAICAVSVALFSWGAFACITVFAASSAP
ncbi:MAG: hypothetical protein ACPHN2_11140 [Sinimarinibacterium flocculans]|uniref:hypothetical protein n=1 Tax=Sinimarinibacterium flocculans TaxID=985250 RepID=UPI003C4F5A50